MINQITFLGEKSLADRGYHINSEDKDIGDPSKIKLIRRAAFSNLDLDFSGIYGDQKYTNRSLKYPFHVLDKKNLSREKMLVEKTKLINWLMNSDGKQKLYDDEYPGYYFLAEVVDKAAFQDDWETGIVTVTFDAYPFMICEIAEGNDDWDEIDFEFDILQPVSFEVAGSLEVLIENAGVPDVFPEITADSKFTIIASNGSYEVLPGVTKSLDFSFESGENKFTLVGNGSISFEFYKELI